MSLGDTSAYTLDALRFAVVSVSSAFPPSFSIRTHFLTPLLVAFEDFRDSPLDYDALREAHISSGKEPHRPRMSDEAALFFAVGATKKEKQRQFLAGQGVLR